MSLMIYRRQTVRRTELESRRSVSPPSSPLHHTVTGTTRARHVRCDTKPFASGPVVRSRIVHHGTARPRDTQSTPAPASHSPVHQSHCPLSPGRTNFHIAGKEDHASMDHPREVHFLPTKAFHRSGTRCINTQKGHSLIGESV